MCVCVCVCVREREREVERIDDMCEVCSLVVEMRVVPPRLPHAAVRSPQSAVVIHRVVLRLAARMLFLRERLCGT